MCERGGVLNPLVAGVPGNPDGSFASDDVPVVLPTSNQPTAAGETCRLRAVPAGAAPMRLEPFDGPRLAIGKFSHVALTSGPNQGLVYDDYVHATGTAFAATTLSFGRGGLFQGFVKDPVTLAFGDRTFDHSGSPVDDPARSHFGLEIDGPAAYPPGRAASGIGTTWTGDNPGLRPLDSDIVSFAWSTGDLTVRETNPLVKCGPSDVYPPTTTSCTRFSDVPVVLERTTEFSRDASVVRVVDRWSSTDGRSHRLDLSLSQNRCFGASDCSTGVVDRLPGRTYYSAPAAGYATGPLAAGGQILSRDVHDPALGGTAVTFGQAVDAAEFSSPDAFTLEYRARTIPATGALVMTHTYVTSRVGGPLGTPPRPQPHGATPQPTAVPRITRTGRVRVRRAGGTFVVTRDRVQCPPGGPACALRLRGALLKPSQAGIAAGATARAAFRLNRRGVRALTRRGRVRLRVALSARAGDGAPIIRVRALAIRLP